MEKHLCLWNGDLPRLPGRHRNSCSAQWQTLKLQRELEGRVVELELELLAVGGCDWPARNALRKLTVALSKTIGTLRSNYSKLPLTSGHFNPVNWCCLLESSLSIDSTSICARHVLLTLTSASFSFSRPWCSNPPRPYLALPPTFVYDWRASPEQPL